MDSNKNGIVKTGLAPLDWMIAGGLGLAALVLGFCSLAGYVFPGESAHLAAVWSGLDSAPQVPYPLMRAFAGLFGFGNAIAPVCAAVSVAALYLVLVCFVRLRLGGDDLDDHELQASRLGGLVTAVVFMLTPAVREASSHLEPRMFDFAWAMATFVLLIPFFRLPKAVAWLIPVAMGVMASFGLVDTPLFLLLLPLLFVAVWSAAKRRSGRGYGAAALFLVTFLVAFLVVVPCMVDDFAAFVKDHKAAALLYTGVKGWLFVFLFATLPFLISLASSRKAFAERSGWTQWFFHIALTFVAILSIATPLSPSALMRAYGILPVAASAFAAFTAGSLAAYWRIQGSHRVRANESLSDEEQGLNIGRIVAYAAGGVFAATLGLTALINLCMFDRNAGAFADRVAERVLADLGDRNWFITDGTLDDHLRFAARRQGRELNLVCLQRDLDKDYLAEFGELIREKKLGGARNEELAISLSLGVLTFVQDWFAADPEAAKSVAVFGAPDLWYAAKIKPVPEFLFFGADPERVPDWGAWNEFREILSAPKNWGSYRLWEEESPVERMRLNLRRHLGLVANDRGVWLQDEGKDDEAFELYDLVLTDIDTDNVCALFNEFELARKGQKKAAARKVDLERRLKAIRDDGERRYKLWALANYYGYIRSPEIFIRLGYAWARSGRMGEALQQIRRAIDFIPTDNRDALMNMMAALYASENDQRKSREMYEAVLAKDAENHDALVGMMRLELLEGNSNKAIEYLERATQAAGDDPRTRVEVALLHLMRGRLGEAREVLQKLTDVDHGHLQAWSMLAAVTIQQIDSTEDAEEKKALTKYLEDVVLATMEKQARSASDYYLQTTRAFVLLRRGERSRREARDAFVAAAKDRPDIAATSDLILGLDISLNDTEDAERQARDVLRRNRKAPLANYVMGSLALQNGRYVEAESFLRRAVDTPKPVSLALNDLAEVLRRNKNLTEAEAYARKATTTDPSLYVAWETLGAILMDAKRDLDEAESCVLKACELSKGKDGKEADVRMLISLARVQIARGDSVRGKGTLRKVNARIGELSDFERKEFEELRKSAR